MIFVSVSEDNSANSLAILSQVRNVGDNYVDAEQLGFGEHEPRIDDNNVVPPPHGHAVHAELA